MPGRFTLSSSYVAPGWNVTVSTWDYSLQIVDGTVRRVDVRWFSNAGTLVPPYMMPTASPTATFPSGTSHTVIASKSTANQHLSAITTNMTGSVGGEPLAHLLNRAVKIYVSSSFPGIQV